MTTPAPDAPLPGDLDRLVADDHAVVERQFQHLEAGRGDRRTLADQVSYELALHAYGEETVMYPGFVEVGMVEDSEEAHDDHADMKKHVTTLDGADPGDEKFEDALLELIRDVRHHAPEEEHEMLPPFRRHVGSAQMGQLGHTFTEAKRNAPTRAHPHAPDEGVKEQGAGVLAAPLDKLRDLASGRLRRLATDASGLLDEQAQGLLDAYASLMPRTPELQTPDVARAEPTLADAVRARAKKLDRATEPEEVAHVETKAVEYPSGVALSLRVYHPRASDGAGLPVLLWAHGGGFVFGDTPTYDASCRGLANATQALVIAPEYRLAPEHPFPAAFDDVLAAYRWACASADVVGGDPSRVAVGGEGVGATMAAAASLTLLENDQRMPATQVLVHPLTTTAQYGESMQDSADARPLNRPLLSWCLTHAFHGTTDSLRDPRMNLLDLPVPRLAAMPPTVVVTVERDPLRSQGQAFAERLREAGTLAAHLHYAGVPHDFLGAATVLDKARDAQRQIGAHLRTTFG
ncbi:MAG TPA: alpha/beta hydrolase fold domain-containing protein [Segeticoccus sp.]|uniref:alpha/beta hydrolase fold domain-containing protein n=1 Tax=Segeticoccus sp. TaxID=2706531 RepID=UPI002D7E75FB|nr:alpha/beta hydrolase fold domain-containing protein [Segeticoccus sp.]HET8599280.1 alpha/beta hydrolase fold domain-containing protein [Segeticoccus sp.]